MSSDDRIPWITWISGSLAVLVFAAAAFVFWSPRPGPGEAAVPEPPPSASTARPASPSVQPSASTEPHPLDISALLTDARTRANLRFETAALVGVRLIIEGGRPLGPIEVTYAKTRDRALPGASVTGPRLRISYDAGRATQEEDKDRSLAHALADPNCPLEAAFRATLHAGGPASARYFAMYAHSPRQGRPLWTMTAGSGRSYLVDADRCAVLVR